MYLFKRDSYFSGISADSSVLIHDYTNISDNNAYIIDNQAYALIHVYANKYFSSSFACYR